MNKKILAMVLAAAAMSSASLAQAKETVKIKPAASTAAKSTASKSNVSKTGNMYLRADLGYGVAGFKTNGFKENAKGTILSGGFGYNAAPNVRAELQLYHNLGSEAKKSVTNGKKKFEQQTTAVLANVYYDFNNDTRFTPYVMAGAGVAHNKMKGSEPNVTYKSKGTNNLALQTGAGVATKVAENTFFDVRYNLLNKGVDYKFANGSKLKTGLEHSVMAGVRVHF